MQGRTWKAHPSRNSGGLFGICGREIFDLPQGRGCQVIFITMQVVEPVA